MGLDMYLSGKKYTKTRGDIVPEVEDGFRVKEKILELGYWRKHPNLHGFIVQEFAKGKDECQEIELSRNDLFRILEAAEVDAFPETTGFFFGTSLPEHKDDTIQIIRSAIKWLDQGKDDEDHYRWVVYRASW
jgi:hypothetical protein